MNGPPPAADAKTYGLTRGDAHDRVLSANVHPADWQNPEPPHRYNLVVIGGGTAGLVAAIGAGVLGAKVALVEDRLLGGDCLNFGCVPSKALLRSARAVYEAKRAARFGVRHGAPLEIDFAQAMARLREVRAQVSEHDAARRVAGYGVDVHLGQARFVSRDTVMVDGRSLRFAKAIVATGSRPKIPDIPGLAESNYLTNESFFSLERLPPSLVVLGAGPVGCELAQAMSRMGSQVTLITRAARILPREDADVSELLARRFAQESIAVETEARVERVQPSEGGTLVSFSRAGVQRQVLGAALLVATGRQANSEGLNLDAAGVRHDEHGVTVNDRLMTSNRRVYAAGDVCSRYRFTHAAEAQARAALQNALFVGRKKASRLLIPWCTYTDPQVAHVGLGQREADERGLRTYTAALRDVDRAIIDDATSGLARVHVSGSGKIFGATVVADDAGDLLAEVVLAMNAGQSLARLGSSIRSYPTRSEVWKQLADERDRSRVTPGLLRLLELFLRLRR